MGNVSDEKLLEELASLEVHNNFVEASSDKLIVKGLEFKPEKDIDDEFASELINFAEVYVCENELTEDEVADLLDFYGYEYNYQYSLSNNEEDLYSLLMKIVDDYWDSKASQEEKDFQEEIEASAPIFEAFSENYDEEYAELEAKLQQAETSVQYQGGIPRLAVNNVTPSNVKDLMVLGLI